MVSYESKQNWANLEENRDGHEPNYSRNFGVEGPTNDAFIVSQRESTKRSLLGTLFLSQGVPMLLGGDELSRTQHGNNNAYCQDNELSWYNWDLDERKLQFLDYVRETIAFRKQHPNFRRHRFLTGVSDNDGAKDVLWWHPAGREMTSDDWHSQDLSALGMILRGDKIYDIDSFGELLQDRTYLVVFNASSQPIRFLLPGHPSGAPCRWQLVPEARGSLVESILEPSETVELRANLMAVLEAEMEVEVAAESGRR
jgi:glycogen operon protein